MRPSQYHYIKCVVTRTAYNRKMQKKRAKKRKKELREKNRQNRIYTFQKKIRKHFCHLRTTWIQDHNVCTGRIFLRNINTFSDDQFFCEMEKVCESKRYNRHYNSIHTKHSNLGWINISILIFNKSGQEKKALTICNLMIVHITLPKRNL